MVLKNRFDFTFACILMVGMGGLYASEEHYPKLYPSEGRFRHYTLEELMAVEVKAATKMDLTMLETPGIGSVMTREEIDAYGWQTLSEILLRQPGFAPSQDYERVTPSMRGQYENWNNNHLRLLINGLPVNSNANGTAYIWEMLPLSLVESIEILRGPGSALYGSNATNGVIAINTRQSEQGYAQGSVTMGNAETQIYALNASKGFPKVQVSGGFQYHATNGNAYLSYDASRRTGSNGKFIQFQTNDQRSTQSAYLQAEGLRGLSGLSLHLNLAYWNFETGHGWLYRIPDEPERAYNNQELAIVSYKPPALLDQRLQLEFVASYQSTAREYRIKFLPDSLTFLGALMPNGVTERVGSKSSDIFNRAQAEYFFSNGMNLLLGLENLVYFSQPNSIHQSNVNLNRGDTLQPFPDGQMHDLRSSSERFEDHPIENLGVYLQGSTGRIIHQKISATAGIRYDLMDANYIDIDQPSRPVKEKFLDQVSPRLGLVFFPKPSWTLKALAERAFRSPAPSELFATHSLLAFSNPDPLEAETMTTYTLASDVVLMQHLNLRIDGFVQQYENQIAFSGSKNYTSNIYSRTVNGIESEMRFEVEPGLGWNISGFMNHTLSHQLSEKTLEPGIVQSERLTWAPEHVANCGALLSYGGFLLSFQLHYQGTVYRRSSDYQAADGTPTPFSAYRPRSLDPWTTLDLGMGYHFENGLSFKVRGTNVLDEVGYLMKPGNYPFDYQIQGLRLEGKLEYAFTAPQGTNF